MKALNLTIYAMFISLLYCSVSSARTIDVGPGRDYTTISAGLSAAQSGDIVSVYVGSYNEGNLTVNNGVSLGFENNGTIVNFQAGANFIIYGSLRTWGSTTFTGSNWSGLDFKANSFGDISKAIIENANCGVLIEGTFVDMRSYSPYYSLIESVAKGYKKEYSNFYYLKIF